jgi:hypothetical protein
MSPPSNNSVLSPSPQLLAELERGRVSTQQSNNSQQREPDMQRQTSQQAFGKQSSFIPVPTGYINTSENFFYSSGEFLTDKRFHAQRQSQEEKALMFGAPSTTATRRNTQKVIVNQNLEGNTNE